MPVTYTVQISPRPTTLPVVVGNFQLFATRYGSDSSVVDVTSDPLGAWTTDVPGGTITNGLLAGFSGVSGTFHAYFSYGIVEIDAESGVRIDAEDGTEIDADGGSGINDSITFIIQPDVSAFLLPQEETKTFLLQAQRTDGLGNVNWVNIPVSSVKGQQQKNAAGQMTVTIPDDATDYYRSRLFEGEKVRAFRGSLGRQGVGVSRVLTPLTRCWTGYVDSPTANDQGTGIKRTAIITDNMKELMDAIFIEGVVYDTFRPGHAAADAIARAMAAKQWKPTDDNGNAYASGTALVSFSSPNGNAICYFPDIINNDGTTFHLASGTLGSFTQGLNVLAGSLQIPAPQPGASYSAFLLPNQYLISSTARIFSPFSAVTGPATFPPPVKKVIVDFFNGVMYFNPADASATVSFSASYYTQPLWAYAPGDKIGDAVSELMDKTGYRWQCDGNGKFIASYIDATTALKKIFPRSQYTTNQVESNRDRRNVIVCEGFDGTQSTLIVSKAVNLDDINNGPLTGGLNKRQYMIAQDTTWVNQRAVNNAAYFGIEQLSRRGKIVSVNIIDDPTIHLEDVIGFTAIMPEIDDSDLFYVEGIAWQYSMDGGKLSTDATLTGTMRPGQGYFNVGPPKSATGYGQYDITQDETAFDAVRMQLLFLDPGYYWSTHPKGANVAWTFNAHYSGVWTGEFFGSDGIHIPRTSGTVTASGVVSLGFSTAGMTQGAWYAFKGTFQQADVTHGFPTDLTNAQGVLGVFRTFFQII